MTTIKAWDKGINTIKIKFPQEKFGGYLLKTDNKKEDSLDEGDIEKVFTLARTDFLNGNLSSDDLSEICQRLVSISVRNRFELKNELGGALEAAMELSFYIRLKDEEGQKWFTQFISTVLNYK